MRATDLPELRWRVLDYLHSGWPERDVRAEYQVARRRPLPGTASMSDELERLERDKETWASADLFFVSDEMRSIAFAAGQTMPGFKLDPSDLPSPTGVIYFDGIPSHPHNPDAFPLNVWTWRLLPGLQRREGAFVEVDAYGGVGAVPGTPVIKAGGYGIPSVWEGTAEDRESSASAFTLICTWLLMQQAVATVTEERPDRPSRRRMQKAGRDPSNVRVVTLRHTSTGTGDGSRDYHHRWVVKGHWRKQWYPSQDRHVPIWITPYVKGPDGAPLLGGEKVYAWTR